MPGEEGAMRKKGKVSFEYIEANSERIIFIPKKYKAKIYETHLNKGDNYSDDDVLILWNG